MTLNEKIGSMLKMAAMLLIFSISAVAALAQQAQVRLNAQEITTDDPLVISVEVSGGQRFQTPRFPALPGMQQTGTSTNQSFGPGGSKVTFSGTYYATQPGTVTIPSFSVQVDGKVLQTQPMTVVVKKGTGQKKAASNQRKDPFDDFFKNQFGGKDPFADMFQQTDPSKLEFKEVEADYFLALKLDKAECYVGEQILGEVVLYINEWDANKINIDGRDIGEMQNRIRNQGFWQEIFEFKTIPMNRVSMNGKNYIAYTLYRTALFPTKSGKIEFKDIWLDGKKMAVATNGTIFDRMMGTNVKFDPIKIYAGKKELNVKPLPPTTLPNANLVGKFSMATEPSVSNLKTGDVMELTVRIRGNGNIAMMKPPLLPVDESFEQYEPASSYETFKTETTQSGEKVFTYSMMPSRAGNYNVGPVKFYYFDPAKRAYDSLMVDAIPVQVEGEDLKNQVLKSSRKDQFYEAVLTASEDRMTGGGVPPSLGFFGGIALAAGAAVLQIRRRRAASKEPDDSGNPEKSFWEG